jgi:predicted aspartyl protease
MVKGKHKLFIFGVIILLSIMVNDCKASSKEENILNGGYISTKRIKESTVPFESKDGLIYVKVRINESEKEYNFVLDTGAGATVISKNVAESLGLKVESKVNATDATNNSQNVDLVTLKSLKMGEVAVNNCGAIIIDLGNVESYGLKFDGCIGTNFLKLFIVNIDNENEHVTFSTKQSYLENLNIDKFLNFTYSEGHLPLIKVKLADGTLVDAVVDTGMVGSVLPIPIKNLDQFQSYLNCKLVKSQGSTFGSAFSSSNGIYSRLNEIWIDDNQVRNLPIVFCDTDYLYMPNGLLSHYNMIINYPKRKMFLIPIKDKPFETNILTFGFMAQTGADGKRYIVGIYEGSPAEKNGLKVGDQVISETYEKSDTVHIVVNNENGEKEIVFKSAMLLPEINNK